MTVNFARLVMPRLAECAKEMGVTDSWATAPRQAVTAMNCPFAYSLLGGTFAPSVKSKGVVKVSRVYIQRFFLAPFFTGLDDANMGAEANEIALDWESRIHFYYQAHNRLGTDELPDLRYCLGVMGLSDVGLTTRLAPGGSTFATLEYSIQIVMAARVDTFSAPYQEIEE